MPNDTGSHQYDSLRAEDPEDLDVGTEPIDLEEKDYLGAPQSRRERVLAAVRRYRWLIDGLLIAVIVVLLVDRQWVRRDRGKPEGSHLQGTGDVTGFAPQCKSIMMFGGCFVLRGF
jgi:hypothetical protein